MKQGFTFEYQWTNYQVLGYRKVQMLIAICPLFRPNVLERCEILAEGTVTDTVEDYMISEYLSFTSTISQLEELSPRIYIN